MHSFNPNWLEEFKTDGLIYSVTEDGAYCKYCKLFPGGERGMLVEKPFHKWKDAIQEFNAHFRDLQKDKTKGCHGNKIHIAVAVRAIEFLKCIDGERLNIDQVLDIKSQAQILENRDIVKSIAKTIYFLQSLPIRGHHDDSQHLEMENANAGNFQELLKFRCKAGDVCLQEHFKEGQKNATYRSKTIQNQIIEVLGDQLLEGIIANVKAAKYFAVSADEATDRGLQTQLTVTVHYADEMSKLYIIVLKAF